MFRSQTTLKNPRSIDSDKAEQNEESVSMPVSFFTTRLGSFLVFVINSF